MLIRRRVVRKCLTSYPDPAASVGVSAGAKPSLLGLQAALTLQPFHSLSVKPSSGSSLGKPRSSFVQEPSCNHMQLLGWDLPVNLVFRTLFFFFMLWHRAWTWGLAISECSSRLAFSGAGPSGPRCSGSTSASSPPLFRFLTASPGVLYGAEPRVWGLQSWLLASSHGGMRKLKETLSHALLK